MKTLAIILFIGLVGILIKNLFSDLIYETWTGKKYIEKK